MNTGLSALPLSHPPLPLRILCLLTVPACNLRLLTVPPHLPAALLVWCLLACPPLPLLHSVQRRRSHVCEMAPPAMPLARGSLGEHAP